MKILLISLSLFLLSLPLFSQECPSFLTERECNRNGKDKCYWGIDIERCISMTEQKELEKKGLINRRPSTVPENKEEAHPNHKPNVTP